jgi:hypothetical protein
MLNMSNIIELSNTIAFQTIIEGGYTTDLKGENPEDGYMASMYKEHELTLDLEDVKEDINLLISNLQVFMKANNQILSYENNYVGTWIDKGLIYIDISTKMRTVAQANRAAAIYNQLEYYGVKEGKSFKTINPDQIEKVELHRFAPELSKIHMVDGTVHSVPQISKDYSWEHLAEQLATKLYS